MFGNFRYCEGCYLDIDFQLEGNFYLRRIWNYLHGIDLRKRMLKPTYNEWSKEL